MPRRKTQKTVTVLIDAQFGSPFMEEFFTKTLHTMLRSLRMFMVTKHKDNRIDVIVDGANISEDSSQS